MGPGEGRSSFSWEVGRIVREGEKDGGILSYIGVSIVIIVIIS